MARFYRMTVAVAFGLMVWSVGFWCCGDSTFGEDLNPDAGYPGVCLDAGHGGPEACKWYPPCTNGDGAGTYGPAPDRLTEAWVNHEIVPLANSFLQSETYVICTKSGITQALSKIDRCNIANTDQEVDVFISVHHEGDIRVYDTRVFYANDLDISNPETGEWKYKIALGLANEINRGFGYGMQVKDDTQSGPEFLDVLQYTWMPAALTEASCIGHASEESLMAYASWHRQDEALGICGGYLAYADTFTCPQNFGCYAYYVDEIEYIAFQWNPVEGADGYLLYRDVFDCPPIPPCSFYDTQNFPTYSLRKFWVHDSDCFAVQAYVNGPSGTRSVGGLSECKYGHECGGTAITRWISGFTATGGNHADSLSWYATSFEEWVEFEIWRSTNGGQSYDDSVGSVDYDPYVGDHSFVDTTTGYWMTYYYKIRDTEGYGDYAWWGPASAKPVSGVVMPPAPSPVPILGVSHLGDQKVHFCLEQGSEYADHYALSWTPDGGAWADTIHAGERCFELGELQNGTAYCFSTRGVNAAGSTDSSSVVWAVPMAEPSNLTDEAGNECIRLWWDGDPIAPGYTVYFSTSQSNPWQSSVDVGDTTATTLMGLENGTMYYVCVVAYDQFSNETGPSNSVSARPECWSGIPDPQDAPSDFGLEKSYPNPFGSSTAIAYQLAKPCTEVKVVIYDTEGREVRTMVNEGQPAGRYEVKWDGKDRRGRSVPPGVYFYRIEAGDFSETNKMLRVR